MPPFLIFSSPLKLSLTTSLTVTMKIDYRKQHFGSFTLSKLTRALSNALWLYPWLTLCSTNEHP
ncbi:hypothetical protein BCU91_02675 [Shewanella sp. 10N.286.52.B9]|nr:hypothetical protein BCU91_02675 [Shewanella sp. 10N.286.52.B9]PMH99020.1 hypothetical protein BCU55_02180 [Shewanella sp. 10N.286.48.A6]